MPLTKQYTVDVDVTLNRQIGNQISFIIPDTNVYTVTATFKEGTNTFDLSSYTVELLLNNAPLTNVTVDDAVNGVVSVVFDDTSAFEDNGVYKVLLRLTDGAVVRHFNGFNFSTKTLP